VVAHSARVRSVVNRFVAVVMVAAAVSACSNDEASREHCGIGASCATTTVHASVPSTSVGASIAPSSTASSPVTTEGSSTTSPSVGTTDVGSNTFVVPTGQVRVGSGDVFLVHDDGDLWLHPGLLVWRPGTPVRLADMGDPRVPVTEGEGPNTIEDVAGEVGGAVYFSDCCEPLAGDVRAVTGPDTVAHLGAGISLVLSPDRTRLASSNSFGLNVWDLTTGRFTYRDLNNSAAQPVNPWDLTWSADGRRLIVLYLDERGASLLPYSTDDELTPGTGVRLDTRFTPVRPPGVQFCGHGPNGELAIAYYGKDRTVIKFYDPSTLIEKPAIHRELPTGVTSVQLASDGNGLLWIDHSTTWFLPSTGTIRPLGHGYKTAWFAN